MVDIDPKRKQQLVQDFESAYKIATIVSRYDLFLKETSRRKPIRKNEQL